MLPPPQVRELDGPLEQVTLDHRATRNKERKAAERQEQQAGKEGAAAAGEGAAAEDAAAEGAAEGAEAAVKEEGDGAAPMDAEAPGEQAAVKEEQQPEVKQEQLEVKQEEGQAAAAVKEEPAEVKAEPADVKAEDGEEAAAAGGEGGQKAGYWRRKREAQQEALYGELPEWGPAIRGGAANRIKVRTENWRCLGGLLRLVLCVACGVEAAVLPCLFLCVLTMIQASAEARDAARRKSRCRLLHAWTLLDVARLACAAGGRQQPLPRRGPRGALCGRAAAGRHAHLLRPRPRLPCPECAGEEAGSMCCGAGTASLLPLGLWKQRAQPPALALGAFDLVRALHSLQLALASDCMRSESDNCAPLCARSSAAQSATVLVRVCPLNCTANRALHRARPTKLHCPFVLSKRVLFHAPRRLRAPPRRGPRSCTTCRPLCATCCAWMCGSSSRSSGRA